MKRNLIVTHHAPDLDAIASVWLLKRFDSQQFADSPVEFVNPGESISSQQLDALEHDIDQVVHVDTGLGEFDHHQEERASQHLSATKLVFDFLVQQNAQLAKDKALVFLVDFVTEIDHFGEIHWPQADSLRYSMMIHELIRGIEFTDPHNDYSQLKFGLSCLDAAYANLKQEVKAREIIENKGQEFALKDGQGMALLTRNDDTMKLAQMLGYILVIRKDSKLGHVRIKVRPDCSINLRKLYEKILEQDQDGTWFYHQSGKMLLNGSRKHRNQKATSLKLSTVVELVQKLYG